MSKFREMRKKFSDLSSVPYLLKFGLRECYFVNETVFKKVSWKETFFNQSNDRKFENCLFAQ